MLLNRAEVDAGVIPSARARVLALSSYIINDNSFFGLARYIFSGMSTYCKGSILDRTIKVWAIVVLR